MKQQLSPFLIRLRKPSIILSLVSQVITIMLLMGFDVNKNLIMSIAAIVCSMLVTLGILSNPDSSKKGFGDDVLICSNSKKPEKHVKIKDKYVCTECGAIYKGE